MSDAFDIYTLIFLGLAVFILVRLRSVLGTRTGHERPPQETSLSRDAAKDMNDNVIPLPSGETLPEQSSPLKTEQQRSISPTVPSSNDASKALLQIAHKDPDFDINTFLKNASSAYEMIVTAFGKGDKNTLKDLLSNDVYSDFANVIKEREAKGLHAQTEFVSIKPIRIPYASLEEGTAIITVEFLSEIVTTMRNKEDVIVEGSDEKIAEVKDVWTFSRNLGSASPIWILISTENEE